MTPLNPKISVIIPTYKPKDYLWECLESLKRQTLSLSEFEVILVLNGCEEPYLSQIKEYIGTSQLNFNFIHTPIGGVSNARNIALDAAKGDFITFIDDDDYVSEFFLENLLKNTRPGYISASNAIAFCDKDRTIDESYYLSAEFKKCTAISKPSLYQCRRFLNGPWGKLLPVGEISHTRFDSDFSNGEDELFLFEISKNVRGILFSSPDAIYYRRQRTDSAMSNIKSKKFLLTNGFRLIAALSKRYLKAPFKYNLTFYLSRVAAELKCIFIYWK